VGAEEHEGGGRLATAAALTELELAGGDLPPQRRPPSSGAGSRLWRERINRNRKEVAVERRRR
jgi:hypothetical protein